MLAGSTYLDTAVACTVTVYWHARLTFQSITRDLLPFHHWFGCLKPKGRLFSPAITINLRFMNQTRNKLQKEFEQRQERMDIDYIYPTKENCSASVMPMPQWVLTIRPRWAPSSKNIKTKSPRTGAAIWRGAQEKCYAFEFYSRFKTYG